MVGDHRKLEAHLLGSSRIANKLERPVFLAGKRVADARVGRHGSNLPTTWRRPSARSAARGIAHLASLRSAHATDGLGGGAAPHLQRRRAGSAASRRRAALNAPEAIALICDAMLEAARAGADYAEVEAAGRAAVSADEVLPGVPALVAEVRLEVLLDDGDALIVLRRAARAGRRRRRRRPARSARPSDAGAPRLDAGAGDDRRSTVRTRRAASSASRRHYPFDRVNDAARVRSRRGGRLPPRPRRPGLDRALGTRRDAHGHASSASAAKTGARGGR